MSKKHRGQDWVQAVKGQSVVSAPKSELVVENGFGQERSFSPRLLESVVFRRQYLTDLLKGHVLADVDIVAANMAKLKDAVLKIIDKRFVKIKNKDVWFDRDVAGLYPKFDKVQLPYISTYYGSIANFYDNQLPGVIRDENNDFARLMVNGIPFFVMTDKEGRRTFSEGNGNFYLGENGYIAWIRNSCIDNSFYCTEVYGKGNSYLSFNSTLDKSKHELHSPSSYVVLIPIHRLNGKNGAVMSMAQTLLKWFELELIPEGLDEGAEALYVRVMQDYNKSKDDKFWQGDQWLEPKVKDLLLDYVEKQDGELPVLFGRDLRWQRALEQAERNHTAENFVWDTVEQSLLECDYRRVNLTPYDRSQVKDINKGHWELDVQDAQNGGAEKDVITLNVPQGRNFVARPPQLDVDEACICAIDFGTKSTVVVRYQNNESRLIRVGKGDLSKQPTPLDYENPTVIQFKGIKHFMDRYKSRTGRPFTEYNDLVVSHQAVDTLNASEIGSDDCYSFFSELKQWANDKDRKLYVQDLQDKAVELKPYLQLGNDDMDPIELYAYYIGSYINNMHGKICLRYILSYPVNYELDVRKRIRGSIEKGLKKSLPPQILQDEVCMDNFEVVSCASEPAAYAASALRAFDLEPQPGSQNKIYYGVFDFGGGTTDFDFGFLQRNDNQRKFKFKIEQFGKGGDPFLGGENLLNLLAYRVYCDNLESMRKHHITIVRPHDGERKAGTETLVLDPGLATEKARMNLKILSEKLRTVWEGQDDEFNGGNIALFSEQGDSKINVNLEKEQLTSSNCEGQNDEPQKVEQENKQIEVAKVVTALKEKLVADGDSSVLEIEEKQEIESKTGQDGVANNGGDDTTVVKINVKALKELLKRRIDRTVKDFFLRMEMAFEGKLEGNGNAVKIHIFLAGNSCKSQIVKELFEKYKTKETNNLESEYLGRKVDGAIEVHPPLDSKKTQNGEKSEMDKTITGKTGVAFGLIRFRKGGKDITVINRNEDDTGETKFPYYLGEEGENGRFRVLIGEDVGYGRWANFCCANEDEFDIYYTKSAIAQIGELALSAVPSPLHCRLPENEVKREEKYGVFIRKVSLDTIEYAVGTKEDFESSSKVEQLRKAGRIHVKKIPVGG